MKPNNSFLPLLASPPKNRVSRVVLNACARSIPRLVKPCRFKSPGMGWAVRPKISHLLLPEATPKSRVSKAVFNAYVRSIPALVKPYRFKCPGMSSAVYSWILAFIAAM